MTVEPFVVSGIEMVDLHDREGEPSGSDVAHDRRRPGRIEIKNVHLLSLLRRWRSSDAAEAQMDNEPDDGSAQFGATDQLASPVVHTALAPENRSGF
jgi:hypothetical protein